MDMAKYVSFEGESINALQKLGASHISQPQAQLNLVSDPPWGAMSNKNISILRYERPSILKRLTWV